MKNTLITEIIPEDIKLNFKKYICEDNFVGVGTCRISYKINDNLVLKLHLNEIGYKQSKTEYEIYNNSIFDKYKKMLTKQLYFCKEFSVCEYVEPLESYSDGGDIWCRDEMPFKYSYEELDDFFKLLQSYDSDFDIDDLSLSNNLGTSKDGWIVFLDYGSKKSDFDELQELLDNVDYSLLENIREFRNYSSVELYMNKVISFTKWIELQEY